MAVLEETKELQKIRNYLKKNGDNFIFSLMERRQDEVDYESWKSYADVYKKVFSEFGETVVLEKDKRNTRKNKFKFIIKVQLNDTQYYDIIITKCTYTKYVRLGNYKKDII